MWRQTGILHAVFSLNCFSCLQTELRKRSKVMNTKTRTRVGILSLLLGAALLFSLDASGAATEKTTPKKCQVAVHLKTRNTTKEEMASALRKQLNARCKVSVSEQELQDAVNN